MEGVMKRGFTILETLFAFSFLVIGFSALYYWFLTYSTMARHGRDRIVALRILRNQTEQLAAYPMDAKDSTWFVLSRNDTLWVSQIVLDSTKRSEMIADSSWQLERKQKFLASPVEVALRVYKSPANGFVGEQVYLMVGGILHVSP